VSTQYTPPSPPLEQPEQPSRGMSVPHLVVGLVFLGIAGSWGLHELGVIESVQVEWLLPLILVVAGAAGLLASVARSITRRPRSHPTDDPSDDRSDETFVTDETP
jgi:hypothetical protein